MTTALDHGWCQRCHATRVPAGQRWCYRCTWEHGERELNKQPREGWERYPGVKPLEDPYGTGGGPAPDTNLRHLEDPYGGEPETEG